MTGADFSNPSVSRAQQWFQDDPMDDQGRVANLVLELCQNGQFQIAFQIAVAAPLEHRADFFKTVFSRWARTNPQEAIKSLDTIDDSQFHSAALRAAADGWNAQDPAGLAAYAFALPSNDDRDYALHEAMNNWSMQDPVALANWLNSLPRGTEFDSGVALMLARTDSANRPTDVALQWLESISDLSLRQLSFQQIVAEWTQTDPAAAQDYVKTVAWLDDNQRAQILASLTPSP